MTSDTDPNRFRPLNIKFLIKERATHLTFFQSDSETFVKFTSTDPKYQGKVLRLLKEGESDQAFYIREEDLYKYYQYATNSLCYEQSRCTS